MELRLPVGPAPFLAVPIAMPRKEAPSSSAPKMPYLVASFQRQSLPTAGLASIVGPPETTG